MNTTFIVCTTCVAFLIGAECACEYGMPCTADRRSISNGYGYASISSCGVAVIIGMDKVKSRKKRNRGIVLIRCQSSACGNIIRNNNHCNRMRNAYLSNTVSPLNVNRQMHSGSIGSSNRVQIMQLSSA